MSFDLNIAAVCNHRIYRELSELADDRLSLRVQRPIAATANIDLYASDILVPKVDYIVVNDPTVIDVAYQALMIVFKKLWKSTEDFFEICYNTVSGYCPKCSGHGTLNDSFYDVRGQLATVRNEKLLSQNLEKFTITQKNSNPFHLYIGTSLVELLGQKIYDMDYMVNRITQEIQTTLNMLKNLQIQYQKTGRAVTSGELLDKVLQITVTRDQSDPTIMRADAVVTAKSGNPLTFTQYMQTGS